MKIWSSHLLDNLSNCLMNLKNSGDSTGFEPMTSAMPVQCSDQLSYEVTQLRAGQFVGFMFSRERNVVWKMCSTKCGVWNQMKIWSSHLLDNLSNCLMNLNSGDSTGFEPMTMGSNPVESPEFFRFMRQLPMTMGSNPVESPEFFRFMRQLLKLSSKCEDHIFIWFQTPHFVLHIFQWSKCLSKTFHREAPYISKIQCMVLLAKIIALLFAFAKVHIYRSSKWFPEEVVTLKWLKFKFARVKNSLLKRL